MSGGTHLRKMSPPVSPCTEANPEKGGVKSCIIYELLEYWLWLPGKTNQSIHPDEDDPRLCRFLDKPGGRRSRTITLSFITTLKKLVGDVTYTLSILYTVIMWHVSLKWISGFAWSYFALWSSWLNGHSNVSTYSAEVGVTVSARPCDLCPPTCSLSEEMLTSWPVCLSRFSSWETTTCPSWVKWQSSSIICVPCSTALQTDGGKTRKWGYVHLLRERLCSLLLS